MVYEIESNFRRHHISKIFWTPVIGELLKVAIEEGNWHNKFALALLSPEVGVVGHVP